MTVHFAEIRRASLYWIGFQENARPAIRVNYFHRDLLTGEVEVPELDPVEYIDHEEDLPRVDSVRPRSTARLVASICVQNRLIYSAHLQETCQDNVISISKHVCFAGLWRPKGCIVVPRPTYYPVGT